MADSRQTTATPADVDCACVVPCYCEEQSDVETTVASCLAQLTPFSWVYLIDDGSLVPVLRPPATMAGSQTVQLIRFDANVGISTSRNTAIAQVSTPLVACVNCQVLLPAGWLSTLKGYLLAHPRVGIVFGQTVSANPRSIISQWRMRFHEPRPQDQSGPAPFAIGHAVLFRRAAFDTVGGYDPARKRIGEDGDLCDRMRKAGWDTHFVANCPPAVSTQVDTLWSIARKQLIRGGWWPNDSGTPWWHILWQTRDLATRMARNLASGRIQFLPVDLAVWVTGLLILSLANRRPA